MGLLKNLALPRHCCSLPEIKLSTDTTSHELRHSKSSGTAARRYECLNRLRCVDVEHRGSKGSEYELDSSMPL